MKKFEGVFTALITPFVGEKIDYTSLEKLVKFQIENGINGFVINGTTAESPNISDEEKANLFKNIKTWTQGNVPLILGTGSNSTAKTIEDTKKAQELGADAVLVVVPYYNKPPQRGLAQHFKAVAASTALPVILYNVPGRTITALESETIKELSAVKNIIGIKEATGKIEFEKEIINKCGTSFLMLSGDDATYVDFLVAGGHGVISVASHIIPKAFVNWTEWVKKGQAELAKQDIQKHLKLIDLLFVEANPIPVKKALQLMGIISSAELRLPLVELESKHIETLKQEMKKLGLI